MRAFHDASFRLSIPAVAGLLSVKSMSRAAGKGKIATVCKSPGTARWSGCGRNRSQLPASSQSGAPKHSDFLFIESENSLGQSIFDPTELNHQGLKRWRGEIPLKSATRANY
jgi:hypothetical protein